MDLITCNIYLVTWTNLAKSNLRFLCTKPFDFLYGILLSTKRFFWYYFLSSQYQFLWPACFESSNVDDKSEVFAKHDVAWAVVPDIAKKGCDYCMHLPCCTSFYTQSTQAPVFTCETWKLFERKWAFGRWGSFGSSFDFVSFLEVFYLACCYVEFSYFSWHPPTGLSEFYPYYVYYLCHSWELRMLMRKVKNLLWTSETKCMPISNKGKNQKIAVDIITLLIW